jgi:hypothetical protein
MYWHMPWKNFPTLAQEPRFEIKLKLKFMVPTIISRDVDSMIFGNRIRDGDCVVYVFAFLLPFVLPFIYTRKIIRNPFYHWCSFYVFSLDLMMLPLLCKSGSNFNITSKRISSIFMSLWRHISMSPSCIAIFSVPCGGKFPSVS